MGSTIATLDNSAVWDSALEARAIASRHDTLATAVERARELAARGDADAAVVETADGFEVHELPELSTLDKKGSTNLLHDGARGLVAVYAGTRDTGVCLRRTSDRSSRIDQAIAFFERAGFSSDVAARALTEGLSVSRAAALSMQLAAVPPPSLSEFGPRTLAFRLLDEIQVAGQSIPAAWLVSRLQQFKSAVALRPDGFLVRLVDAKVMHRAGLAKVTNEGRVVAGHFEMGIVYVSRTSVFYHADEMMRPVGPALAEACLQKDVIGHALNGVETAVVKDTFAGLARLWDNPVRCLKDLGRLPAGLATLLRHTPELWERFAALPLGEQAEAVTQLSSNLALIYGGGFGVMTGVAKAGATLAQAGATVARGIPLMLPNGAWALAKVVSARQVLGVAVQAASGGPGALGALHMASSAAGGSSGALPNPVSQGHVPRFGGAKPAPGTTGLPSVHLSKSPGVPSLPPEMRKAGDIVTWLERNGFTFVRTKGSHHHYQGPNGGLVTVAYRRSTEELCRGSLNDVRRQIIGAQR